MYKRQVPGSSDVGVEPSDVAVPRSSALAVEPSGSVDPAITDRGTLRREGSLTHHPLCFTILTDRGEPGIRVLDTDRYVRSTVPRVSEEEYTPWGKTPRTTKEGKQGINLTQKKSNSIS